MHKDTKDSVAVDALPRVAHRDSGENSPSLDELAMLLGDLVDDLTDDPASRLTLVAHAAIARLGRSLGAERALAVAVDRRGAAGVVVAEWSMGGAQPAPAWLNRRMAEIVPLSEMPLQLQAMLLQDAAPQEAPLVELGRRGGPLAIPVRSGTRVSGLLLLTMPGEQTVTLSEPAVGLVRAIAAMVLGAWELLRLARRPGLDERSGLADRRLLLVELGRMLRRVELGRSYGVGAVVVQLIDRANTAAEHRVALLRVGAVLEQRFGDANLVAFFDQRMLVVACEGLAVARAAVELAREMVAVIADEGPGWPRVVCGVAHTSEPVAAGVLLRRADTAAHRAGELGRRVVLSNE